MAKRLQLARPIVRRGACLDADKTEWQLLKEREDKPALQLAADNHLASSINAVHLKDRFGDVETDCRNRLHGSSSESWEPSKQRPRLWHSSAGWRSRPQHQKQTHALQQIVGVGSSANGSRRRVN